MNEYSIIVNFGKGKIVTDLSKLVKNDYNSTKFNFTFDKEGTSYLFKLLYPDNTYWVKEIVDGSLVLEKGVLHQSGSYKFEISLYGADNKLTDTAIHEFYVRKDLVETDEEVKVDDRVPILDDLINRVNEVSEDVARLDIDVEKQDKIVTVEITKKDGSKKSVEIIDGEDGYTPQKGIDYFDGKDGYTPVKGKDYFDGNNALINGKNSIVIKAGKNINIENIENGIEINSTGGGGGQTDIGLSVIDGLINVTWEER